MNGETLFRLLLIGGGGFVGAVLRFFVSSWVQARSGSIAYPFGTLSVNMIGCLLIGFLSALAENRPFFSAELRGFLLAGLLGAFTTFSTFSNDTFHLLQDARFDLALLNAGSQVFFGITFVWLGRILASLF